MRRWAMVAAAGTLAAMAGLEALAPQRAAQEMPRQPAAATTEGAATAIFAGGCFWCMEPPFDKLDGVLSTTSGYTGGAVANPSYKQVSAGGTGHAEVLEIRYDPKKVTYEKLLDVFWHNIDPLDGGGQFCDRGSQYRSAIFPLDEEQKRLAEASKQAIQKRFDKPVATAIEPAAPFYAAEGYHQNYYQTNPLRYTYYRYACGRDQRLEQLWGPKPTG